uniref:Reverse transcriptase domain-containing protein n=1 Tax=Tanacetum cinerariifolium TaxID=118510 RepID=A0A699HYB7_TANCI|nr:reverse transcriptase domain-containing protein [Tanacetum cinerariifolium]
MEKEELIVYLAATREAVSAVLMTEREAKQMSVYFVIHTLQGPEINYTLMEKPANQADTVKIRGRRKASEIECRARAGLILTNPEGAEFTYTLRFRSKKSPRKPRLPFSRQSELKDNSINEAKVLAVVEEERDTWMAPIYNYLTEETLPAEKENARVVRRKSGRYAHACRNKICGSKGHTDRILLADNARGCKKIDKSMSRLPGSPPSAKKSTTKIDSHHALVAILQMGNRHSRTLPGGTWKSQIPNSNNRLLYDAHRTMIKSSNEDTPFSLTYGTKVVIPSEIGMHTIRTTKVDIVQNAKALEINLDLLEERREQAVIREAKSKAKMEKYYNYKIRNTSFKPGDLVTMSNEASHAKESGKLRPKCEGPYEVTEALGNEAYKLRDRNGKILLRTWNVLNLKKCYIHEIGPSFTSPTPSTTPPSLGNCYTPTFDPETSQSGQQDDNDSDDGNRKYDVDIYDDE